MKKKIHAVLFVSILLLSIGLFCGARLEKTVLNAKPALVMLDGVLYSVSGCAEQRPDAPPDGTIREVLETGEFPTENGQANFGSPGMHYWRVDEGIVVEASMYYVLTESN